MPTRLQASLRVAARVVAPSVEACDAPLGHRGLPPMPGACYPALRRLPGRDSHPLESCSSQTVARTDAHRLLHDAPPEKSIGSSGPLQAVVRALRQQISPLRELAERCEDQSGPSKCSSATGWTQQNPRSRMKRFARNRHSNSRERLQFGRCEETEIGGDVFGEEMGTNRINSKSHLEQLRGMGVGHA